MPHRGTIHLARNPIKFTNEEVATLRAFKQLPSTATKADISALAKRILDETKDISQKTFEYRQPTRNLRPEAPASVGCS